jgi:hypothetical protein
MSGYTVPKPTRLLTRAFIQKDSGAKWIIFWLIAALNFPLLVALVVKPTENASVWVESKLHFSLLPTGYLMPHH